MNLNQFTITLLGNINGATAAQIDSFVDFFGNMLFISSTWYVTKVSATGILSFHFFSPYDFDLPTDVAAVVEYDKLVNNSLATTKLTTIQKPVVIQGDPCVVLSIISMEAELNNWQTVDISEITGVADNKIWIGSAASTETDFYTPFTDSVDYKVFQRQAAQSAKGMIARTAANNARQTMQYKPN